MPEALAELVHQARICGHKFWRDFMNFATISHISRTSQKCFLLQPQSPEFALPNPVRDTVREALALNDRNIISLCKAELDRQVLKGKRLDEIDAKLLKDVTVWLKAPALFHHVIH